MKKVIFILIVFMLFITSVNALDEYEKYNINDFVYFDPISNNKCDETNYWTIYNQNTTCYRFVVLENNDSSRNRSLKIMLDHNIGFDVFDNYQSVLEEGTKDWIRYTNTIDIIDENTVYNLMKLSSKPEITEDQSKISVKGNVAFYFLSINSLYYYDGKRMNGYGYWTKDTYEKDSSYAYVVTEYANNRLVSKTQKLGIRPVLIIDKQLLTKGKIPIIDITNSLDKNYYSYKSANKSKSWNIKYKQLQGFTVVNDKLVFYSSNKSKPNNGLLFTYNDSNYSSLYKLDATDGGHGNDLTYNSKTNKVLLVGPNSYSEIYEYNGDTLNFEKKYTMSTVKFSSIAYDDINDYYFGASAKKAYVLDNNFNILYSFDMPSIETSQGMEYYNGYLYNTVFEFGTCPNAYQIYCPGEKYSGYIEVYNAKIDSQGNPDQDFGRLVEKIYIGTGIGEIESVSFSGNKMYIGFAAHSFDSTNVYKFYTIDINKVTPASTINYSITATGTQEEYMINLISDEELISVNGWILSDDNKTLSMNGISTDTNITVNICNRFNYCQNVSFDINDYITKIPVVEEPQNTTVVKKDKTNQKTESNGKVENKQVVNEDKDILIEHEEQNNLISTDESPITGVAIPVALLSILTFSGIVLTIIYKKFNRIYNI